MERTELNLTRLNKLLERERTVAAERTPKSRALAAKAQAHLIGGVPMQWMEVWVGQHVVFFERAKGNRIVDV
ncbi:MAG: aspartate aminotransferase family protein, partial [Actinobacteria bacterium]|nr:aspartate aminotransferase family protein [Actinomycetota bacterium]